MSEQQPVEVQGSLTAEQAAAQTPTDAPKEEVKAEAPQDPEALYLNEVLKAGLGLAKAQKPVYIINVISHDQKFLGDYYVRTKNEAKRFLAYIQNKNPGSVILLAKGKFIPIKAETRFTI